MKSEGPKKIDTLVDAWYVVSMNETRPTGKKQTEREPRHARWRSLLRRGAAGVTFQAGQSKGAWQGKGKKGRFRG